MIVVNPRNHWVKSAIFWMPFWDFHNFDLRNFFHVMFSGGSTVEPERSQEVGLDKVPLVF